MDIERIKKISNAKINAGNATIQVRNTLKEYMHGTQDVQEQLSEVYKPIVKAQEAVKQTIDEKQDKILGQLQENQLALKSGLDDLLMVQQLPGSQTQETASLPIGYKPEMMKADIDKGFTTDEIKVLTKNQLYPPSQVLNAVKNKTLDFDEYNYGIGEKLKTLGREKGRLSKKEGKIKNKDRIDEITEDIKLIHRYRQHISIIPEGIDTIGSGYMQPKRNAYKISSGGKYGNLIIDIPKLMGQLHLVATKDGNKILDKKVDYKKGIKLLTDPELWAPVNKMPVNDAKKLVQYYKDQYKKAKQNGYTKSYNTFIKEMHWGKGLDVHKAIGMLPKPKSGWTLPGHKYTGPYNDLDSQVKYNPLTGEILEIYDKPTGKTDAIAMQHDVDYSVCKDDKKCKNKADRKMVKALDAIPYKERQWGHWLARNAINTKQKLALGKVRKPKN